MKIEIPKMEDYEATNALAAQVHELHVKWRPDLFRSVDAVITEEEFEELIDNHEIYIVRLKNRVVGYMIIKVKEKKHQNEKMRYRKMLNIEAMCIDEDDRGFGIGTALLEYAKEVGIENGCTDMYLTVNEENKAAIRVYEKFGMRVKNIAYSMEIHK